MYLTKTTFTVCLLVLQFHLRLREMIGEIIGKEAK